jgi:hypothetical protein
MSITARKQVEDLQQAIASHRSTIHGWESQMTSLMPEHHGPYKKAIVDAYRAIKGFEAELAALEPQAMTEAGKDAFTKAAAAATPQGDGEALGFVLLRNNQGKKFDPGVADSVRRYESLAEFLAVASKAPGAGQVASSGKNPNATAFARLGQNPGYGAGWEGMAQRMAWPAVRAFLASGWPEGAKKIAEDMEAVQAPVGRDIRRRGVWADDGPELSRDRIDDGHMETPWRASVKQRTFGPSKVRIVVDLGSECSACGTVFHDAAYIPQDGLFWRGAAAACLSQSLEDAGYQVEILGAWAIAQVAGRDGLLARSVVVKEQDEFTDVSRIASVCSCTATYRRAAMLEHLATATYKVNERHGSMVEVETSPQVQVALGLAEEGWVTVFVSDWVLSKAMANAWVRGALYGIESPRTGHTAETYDLDEEELAELLEAEG